MKRKDYKSLINTNNLPKINYKGKQSKIDWNKCIGVQLLFTCGDTSGHVTFIDKDRGKMLIRRVIDGSENTKECWVCTSTILKNNLSHSVFNEIAFTCPELLPYFVNKEDAYIFTKTSQNKSLFKCPVCGHIKSYSMTTISSLGFKCNKCSDKSFKYPNKFMTNLLDQTECKYFTEVTKTTEGYEWLDNYRYDFLVFTKYGKYFIEMDGYFHYYDNTMNGRTAEEQQTIDAYKDSLASQHNCKVIRINCCYRNITQRYEFIKNNIINSEVMEILNINKNDIDWNECDINSTSNTLYEICDYWNSGIHHAKTIAKELGLSWSCVQTNLLKGASLGLCDYDPTIASDLKNKKQQMENSIPVAVFKNNIVIGVFSSGQDLSRQSQDKFGCYFNPGHISYVCRGKCKTCHGYGIKRIAHEEYERLSQQLNSKIQDKSNIKEAV